MDTDSIRRKVKEIIANVTGLDPLQIADDARFVDDLQLDSLALLEITVDVDYEFRLGIEEERLQSLVTVEDAVALVVERVDETADRARVA